MCGPKDIQVEPVLEDAVANAATRDRDLEWFQIIESFMGFHPVSMTDALTQGIAKVKVWQEERDCLKKWVNDLQAGCYINCVYCGHRYGPDTETPVSMADVLKEHIEQCPDHPISHLKKQYDMLVEVNRRIMEQSEQNLKEAGVDSMDTGGVLSDVTTPTEVVTVMLNQVASEVEDWCCH